MAHKALDVAKFIISLSDPEVGDIMTNLKLQKLLYYVQGFSFAIYNKPIFDEDIYAWQYGPVVLEVYHQFKNYESGVIPLFIDFDHSIFTSQEKDLITSVYDVYGQYSAYKLMNMTHQESPWKDTPLNSIITHRLLKSHFIHQIEDEEN